MNETQKADPTIRYPLWIIALSLCVIALCLVWDAVRRSNQPAQSEEAPPVYADIPTSPPADPAPMERRGRPRTPVRPPEPVATEAPVVVDDLAPVSAGSATVPPGAAEAVDRVEPAGGAPAGGVLSGAAGEIVGKVVLLGTPPPEYLIDLKGTPPCDPANPPTTRFFVTGPGQALADTIVYLRNIAPSAAFVPPTNVSVLQFTNCQLEPYVTVMLRGQELAVRNFDRSKRHVMMFTGTNRTIKLPADGRLHPVDFLKFGPGGGYVRAQCVIHPWEQAHVSVSSHPYFAVTDKEGSFRIQNVPPGTYTLAALHLAATDPNQPTTRQITVHAGSKTGVVLTIDAPRQ